MTAILLLRAAASRQGESGFLFPDRIPPEELFGVAGVAPGTSGWVKRRMPGVAIAIVVYSLNMIGDGLRDALDPRLRGLT